MTKITNISAGPRGVNTKSGVVFLAPGQSEDLDVTEGELKSLSKEWFATGALSKGEKAQLDDARAEATDDDAARRVRAATEAQATADKK